MTQDPEHCRVHRHEIRVRAVPDPFAETQR